MDRTKFLLISLAFGMVPTLASAQGLLGLGDSLSSALGMDADVEITEVPDAHWNFEPDADGAHWKVAEYSPNLDGVPFRNRSRCYGHSLLSTRWFQYIVKPLKNGTLSEITRDEFADFWGGKMEAFPAASITPTNVDQERLAPFASRSDAEKLAVAKLVGHYHSYQSNLMDHDRTMYDDPAAFRRDLVRTIHDAQLPPQISLRRTWGGHAVNAYRVDRGTVMWGNNGGEAGYRVRGYRIRLYDPNKPADGDRSHDPAYDAERYLVVVEDGSFIGMSERMEYGYRRYLRQSVDRPAGTWHIPDDNYGIREDVADDSNEVRAWHWTSIDDDEAREIASLD